jgi:hypothetical protein
VLTGVVDLPGLLAAPGGSRPRYVADDLRALLHPQPEVALDGDTARCGPATVRLQDGRLVLDGDADDVLGRVAALRAACALAWRAVDDGAAVPQAEGLAATAERGA